MASDLKKLRDRALFKEFDKYRDTTRKNLKVFRLEAVRASFKRAWQERDYATIITVARQDPRQDAPGGAQAPGVVLIRRSRGEEKKHD